MVTEALGGGPLFLETLRVCSWVKKGSLPPIFGLAIVGIVSALLPPKNAPLPLITIVDLAVYAAVIYKFGTTHDEKRLIFGLLTTARLIKAEM